MSVRPVTIPEPDGTFMTVAVDDRVVRAIAFGAIRRAAATIHDTDAAWIAAYERGDTHTCERLTNEAAAVRQAIRAAIGSDKA